MPKVLGFGHGQNQLIRSPPQGDLLGVEAGDSPGVRLGCALRVLPAV